jgi:hypothetical protein
MVGVPLGEALLEAVNDVFVGDVDDGGSGVEATPGVGPQGLVMLLLALRQVMTSTYLKHEALEVDDENLL